MTVRMVLRMRYAVIVVLLAVGSEHDVLIAAPGPAASVNCGQGALPRRVGGAVKPPRIRHRVTPTLPEKIRKGVRPQPFMLLEVQIDACGAVTAVSVQRSNEPDLEPYVIAAVRQWQFFPSRMNGKPVPVLYNLSFTYEVR